MTAPEMTAPKSASTNPHRFKLHSLKDVLNLPPPDWLVTTVMPIGSQVVLFGPSGSGKSFVALDMALPWLATGQPWQGLE